MLRTTAISLACCVALTNAWSAFVVPHTDGADDTPALMAAVSEYTRDASIVFEANTTYNIWSPITFPTLTNVEVVIKGNLSYPTSIETVQNNVAAAVSFPGFRHGHCRLVLTPRMSKELFGRLVCISVSTAFLTRRPF